MNSGIYQIRNTVTGVSYFGRTSDWPARKRRHIRDLRTNTHKNPRLQHSWNARADSDFEFKLVWEAAVDELVELESFVLEETFDTGRVFNCHKNSIGGSLGQIWTDEQRQKISRLHKGRKHTAAAKARMSAANQASEKCREHVKKLTSSENMEKAIAAAASKESRLKAVQTRARNGFKCFSEETRQRQKDEARARVFAALDWAVENNETRDAALTKFHCSWGGLKKYQPEWEKINGPLLLPKRASGARNGQVKLAKQRNKQTIA